MYLRIKYRCPGTTLCAVKTRWVVYCAQRRNVNEIIFVNAGGWSHLKIDWLLQGSQSEGRNPGADADPPPHVPDYPLGGPCQLVSLEMLFWVRKSVLCFLSGRSSYYLWYRAWLVLCFCIFLTLKIFTCLFKCSRWNTCNKTLLRCSEVILICVKFGREVHH